MLDNFKTNLPTWFMVVALACVAIGACTEGKSSRDFGQTSSIFEPSPPPSISPQDLVGIWEDSDALSTSQLHLLPDGRLSTRWELLDARTGRPLGTSRGTGRWQVREDIIITEQNKISSAYIPSYQTFKHHEQVKYRVLYQNAIQAIEANGEKIDGTIYLRQ